VVIVNRELSGFLHRLQALVAEAGIPEHGVVPALVERRLVAALSFAAQESDQVSCGRSLLSIALEPVSLELQHLPRAAAKRGRARSSGVQHLVRGWVD
jgi:hypothetical protein